MAHELATDRILVWPALLLLSPGREGESSRSLLERIHRCLSLIRWRGDELPPVDRLDPPVLPEHAVNWLHSVWRQLSRSGSAQLVATRRSLLRQIIESSLSQDAQAGLITALDYLFRLVSAHSVSSSGRKANKHLIPVTVTPAMQSAYHRLAQLAATDLPIWLAGERGTELDRLAALIHRLREAPDENLHWMTPGDLSRKNGSSRGGNFNDVFPMDQDSTIVVKDLEETPLDIQRIILHHMVTSLIQPSSIRVVLTSGPVGFVDPEAVVILPDLSAFLGPTRIDIPPLRTRTEDIAELISFFATIRGAKDPVERLDPESLEILKLHNWPGNTAELETAVAYMLARRPSGRIRPEDLPASIGSQSDEYLKLMDLLAEALDRQRFRIASTVEGRMGLARFLTEKADTTFNASEVQRLFPMGRETTRRLLAAMESHGLIQGIKGSTQRRTTRYRLSRLPTRRRE